MTFVQYVSYVKIVFCRVLCKMIHKKVMCRLTQDLRISFEASLESKKILDYNSSLFNCSFDQTNIHMIHLCVLNIIVIFTKCIQLLQNQWCSVYLVNVAISSINWWGKWMDGLTSNLQMGSGGLQSKSLWMCQNSLLYKPVYIMQS